jgi:hypothetical protein
MYNAEGGALPINEPAEGPGSASHVEHRQASASHVEHRQGSHDQAELTAQARQRRKIAQLEEKLVALESGHAVKERYDHNWGC